ncbi:MAG: hypothetical protein QOJ75_2202 [Chloroflexota bacterium]|jgi:hypothetical protein|nr:hypothetical protein [Chloroflexota bacterium]
MNEKEIRVTLDPKQPVDREPFAPVPPETASFPAQPVVPGTPAVQIQRRKSSGGWLNVILVVAAVVAVGGVAFAVGRSTAPVAAAAQRNGNFGNFPRASFAPGQSGAPGGGGVGGRLGGGGNFNLSGTVQSVTADTLTITTANGQTVEFSLGSATTYDSKTPATASAVTPGSKVEVQLDFAGGRPTASAAPSGPVGTASSVTVVP